MYIRLFKIHLFSHLTIVASNSQLSFVSLSNENEGLTPFEYLPVTLAFTLIQTQTTTYIHIDMLKNLKIFNFLKELPII